MSLNVYVTWTEVQNNSFEKFCFYLLKLRFPPVWYRVEMVTEIDPLKT